MGHFGKAMLKKSHPKNVLRKSNVIYTKNSQTHNQHGFRENCQNVTKR